MAMGIFGYVLPFYPPWQVGIGVLVIVMNVYLLIDSKENLKNIPKSSWAFLVASILISFAIIINFCVQNINAIRAYSGTVYPGKRFITGGGLPWYYLYQEIINLYFSSRESKNLWTNVCEASSFITLYPIPFLAFLVYSFRESSGKLVKCLLVVCLFLLSWMYIGYPEPFAKYTLFSYVPSNRMASIPFGLASTYYLVALLCNRRDEKSKRMTIVKLCFCCFYVFLIICVLNAPEFTAYLNSVPKKALPVAVFSCLAFMFFFSSSKKFAKMLLVVCVIPNFWIHPLSRGLSPIYDKQLAVEIRNLSQGENKGLWIADDNVLAQFVRAMGEDVFNGVQLYPDFDKYKLFDPELIHKDIYNRYAHIAVDIVPDGAYFAKLSQTDVISLTISETDLIEKTDVNYVVTRKKLENVAFKMIYEAQKQELFIYRIARYEDRADDSH
jgi:hypothetical protein